MKLHFRFSGEIKLGAIFPIHKRGDGESNPCGKIQREDGIQPLEAMLFTLDEINHKSVQLVHFFSCDLPNVPLCDFSYVGACSIS